MKTKKLTLMLALLLCVVLVFAFAACGGDEVTVSSIALKAGATTAYQVGDAVSLEGMTVVVTWSDGTTTEVPVTAAMLSGFDTATAGTKTVTVTYEGVTTTLSITVTDYISSIALGTGYKSAYFLGETLSVTGMNLTVTFASGATQTVAVTADMVTGFNSATAGANTLTITYEGKTTTAAIEIKNAAPTSIVIPTAAELTAEELTNKTIFYTAAGLTDLTVGTGDDAVTYVDYKDDEFSGVYYKVIWDDGTETYEPAEADLVTGFSTAAVAATQAITLVKDMGEGVTDLTCAYTIEVKQLAKESIAMTANGYKTRYAVGSDLEIYYTDDGDEIANLFIDYKLNSGEVFVVPFVLNGETIVTTEGFDSATVGDKEITVSFQGLTTKFEVTIYTPTTVAADQKVVNDEYTLILSSSTMDGVFNPFFYSSAYDGDVIGMVSASLLTMDAGAAVVAGDEYPTVAKEYEIYYSDDATNFTKKATDEYEEGDYVVYKMIIKNGMKFSNGTAVTADDVLFNYYVYLDPAYVGSSTLYTLPILGLNDYRTQIPNYAAYKAKFDTILAADSYVANDNYTEAEYNKAYELINEHGEKFCQAIVDYCFSNYAAYYPSYIGVAAANATASNKIAAGMALWGFGEVEDGVLTDATGATHSINELTIKDYWDCMCASYELHDDEEGLSDEDYRYFDDYESAGYYFIAPAEADFASYLAGAGASVDNIKGLFKGTETIDGVEYETVSIVLTEQNPKAILSLGVTVAPKAYYTAGYDYDEDAMVNYGVELDSDAFMTHLESFNGAPMGAGPYRMPNAAEIADGLTFATDNTVNFVRNEYFYTMGDENVYNANIKFVQFKVLDLGAEYNALEAGDVHYSDPSATSDVMEDVAQSQILEPILVDNLGYGYICLNANVIDNLYERIALTSVFDLSEVYEYYPDGLADVIYRAQSQVSWAYPEGAEAIYPYDEDLSTAIANFKLAGFTYDEATRKFTDVPTYKFFLPSAANDHPAGGIFLSAVELLKTIGITAEITTDTSLIANIKDGSVGVYALAWSSAADPDMYQVYHKDSAAESVISNGIKAIGTNTDNRFGDDNGTITWKGQELNQKEAIDELAKLIEQGTSVMLAEERAPIYKDALELLALLSIEVPTYQRKNLFIYNSEVIDTTTLSTTVTPYWGPMAEFWKVSFADGIEGNSVVSASILDYGTVTED